jgi:prophage DNA circulation protein
VSTYIAYPTADYSIPSLWTDASSGTTNLYSNLIDASDSTYVQTANTGNVTGFWTMGTVLPSDFGTVTAVSIAVRLAQTGKGSSRDWASVQLFQSNGSSALTSSSTITDTSLTTNYTYAPSIVDSLASHWLNFTLGLTQTTGTSTTPRVYEASVTVTYIPGSPTTSPKTYGGFFRLLG